MSGPVDNNEARRRQRDLAAKARTEPGTAQPSNVIPFPPRRETQPSPRTYEASLREQNNTRYPPWR